MVILLMCFCFAICHICVCRHQLHVPSGHPRRNICASQTATQSHDVHAAAAGGVGNSVRSNPLSGRVHARGSGDEDQFDRGTSAGEFGVCGKQSDPLICFHRVCISILMFFIIPAHYELTIKYAKLNLKTENNRVTITK